MIVALTALATLQTAKPVLLRVKPVKGIVYSYQVRFQMDAGARGMMTGAIPATDRFVGMAGKNHLWSVAFAKPVMTGTGIFKSAASSGADFENLTVLYERTPTYQPVAGTVNKVRIPMTMEKDGTSDIIFPIKAVKVGDTWPGKIKSGSTVFDMTYKFLGSGTYKNLKAWKIEGRPTGKGIRILRPYLWQIDQRDGRTLRAEGQVEVTNAGIVAKMVFTIEQLKRKAP